VFRWRFCVVELYDTVAGYDKESPCQTIMTDNKNYIRVRGAREHNLKNVSLDIPKNKLVVFTGVSGSGKSSLAYDTIYAEGQRRYVESLSTYARQFLGVMEKPDVDFIEGLSPAISIDQKTTSRNPRSTVGTVTEIYDYLRLLYARIGHPHCPICGDEITSQSLEQIVELSFQLIRERSLSQKQVRVLILSPVVRDKKGEFSTLFDNLKAKGYSKVRVDKIVKNVSEDFYLIKTNKHSIEAQIDRLSLSSTDLKNEVFKQNLKSRLFDSIEQSLNLSEGLVNVSFVLDKSLEMPEYPKDFEDHLYSERFACPKDNISIPEIEPRTFSFNSPHGACPACSGIGTILKVEPNFIISSEISITEGAILPFANIFENDTWYSRLILRMCEVHGINPKIPLKKLDEKQMLKILYGTGNQEYTVYGTNRQGTMTQIYEKFPGVIAELEKRHNETDSDWIRAEIEKYMRETICPSCNGTRLKPEALGVIINKLSISDVVNFSITDALSWIRNLKTASILSEREKRIGELILKEIENRLEFLLSVGLEYLNLSRSAGSLSGGEAQRIRLASQIGSGLTGVLYVLDEPTIGLHAKDNSKLIETLKRMVDIGNTVIVVEHDADMIKSADHVIDFGPGAGKFGGKVVAQNTPDKLINDPESITGKYVSGKQKIIIPVNSKLIEYKGELKFFGCSQFNLKKINVSLPLGKMVVITGVSGSGKSTLLVDTVFPALKQELNPMYKGSVGEFGHLEGADNIDKVILIDQSPIGRTPRSNPATYTKVFDDIRDVFARTKDAKALGYNKGRFSFNVKGGRCDACEGQGQNKIEMQFMSDIWVECEVCKGARYNAQTLEIDYKGKNISGVLDMTVSEAIEFFHTHPKIIKKLETLEQVGLGYIELGQAATTISGGEAQRVKLASELTKRDTGNTVYVLDEPTTGLHFADLEKLLKVLRLLVDRGNSVFLIEHNMDVIKNADWIIDLGPDGGDKGGEIVVQGNLETIIKSKASYTAQHLRKH
jgi:excinuclease ABC subunit A